LSNQTEVRIAEAYKNYDPPLNASKVVRKLLASVPGKYLVGLSCVVLTNLSGQSRRNRLGKVTSRGRRIPKSQTLGCYHRAWKGQSPWIELYVDQIASNLRKPLLWLPLYRDLYFGKTLYHELGHHVHLFIRPEHKEKEDVADDWCKRFMKHFLRRKHWYLIPFAKLRKLLKPNDPTDTAFPK